MYFADKQEF